MEREVMKKSKHNFILICMYKKIYEPFFKTQIECIRFMNHSSKQTK